MIQLSEDRLKDLDILPLPDDKREEITSLVTEWHENSTLNWNGLSYKTLIWMLQVASELDYAEECGILEDYIPTIPMNIRILNVLEPIERQRRFIRMLFLKSDISNSDSDSDCSYIWTIENEAILNNLKNQIIYFYHIDADSDSDSDSDTELSDTMGNLIYTDGHLLLDVGIGYTEYTDLIPVLQVIINGFNWVLSE